MQQLTFLQTLTQSSNGLMTADIWCKINCLLSDSDVPVNEQSMLRIFHLQYLTSAGYQREKEGINYLGFIGAYLFQVGT